MKSYLFFLAIGIVLFFSSCGTSVQEDQKPVQTGTVTVTDTLKTPTGSIEHELNEKKVKTIL